MVGMSFVYELAVLKLFKTEVSLKGLDLNYSMHSFKTFNCSNCSGYTAHFSALQTTIKEEKKECFPLSSSYLHHKSVFH